jgi:hypothetical protein
LPRNGRIITTHLTAQTVSPTVFPSKAKTVARAAATGKQPGCATIARADEETDSDVPTNTPPPYFPQNQLSPGDEKTARKLRLTFYGCGVLLLLAAVAVVVGVVYLIRSRM